MKRMGWPAEQPVLECKTACSALQNGPYCASKRPMLPAGHCTRVGAGQQCRVSECFRLPRFTVKNALPYCFTPAFIMMRCVVWFSRWRCSEPFFPKAERGLLRSRQASFTLLSCTIGIGLLQVVACRQACIAVAAAILPYAQWGVMPATECFQPCCSHVSVKRQCLRGCSIANRQQPPG